MYPIIRKMSRINSLFLVLCLSCISHSLCKKFTRCDLAQELMRQGFPRNELSNWVCLVEAESSGQTHVIGSPNSDSSRDWGLFQINDRYWCNTGSNPGKDCNARCQDLITDNITTASVCAKKIYARHGFNAWYGWINKCRGKPLPNLRPCGV